MVRLYESAWKDYDRGQYDAHMQQKSCGRTYGTDIWKAKFVIKSFFLFMQVGKSMISALQAICPMIYSGSMLLSGGNCAEKNPLDILFP